MRQTEGQTSLLPQVTFVSRLLIMNMLFHLPPSFQALGFLTHKTFSILIKTLQNKISLSVGTEVAPSNLSPPCPGIRVTLLIQLCLSTRALHTCNLTSGCFSNTGKRDRHKYKNVLGVGLSQLALHLYWFENAGNDFTVKAKLSIGLFYHAT